MSDRWRTVLPTLHCCIISPRACPDAVSGCVSAVPDPERSQADQRSSQHESKRTSRLRMNSRSRIRGGTPRRPLPSLASRERREWVRAEHHRYCAATDRPSTGGDLHDSATSPNASNCKRAVLSKCEDERQASQVGRGGSIGLSFVPVGPNNLALAHNRLGVHHRLSGAPSNGTDHRSPQPPALKGTLTWRS
jgi:hypothetical protein